MSRSYGEMIRLTLFGSSHGPSVGMALEGIPAGLPVNLTQLQEFLNRRAPGHHEYTSARKESDNPEFTSGITDGVTNGDAITAIILNQDKRSIDYKQFQNCPRPGHADYTAQVKYNNSIDMSGGGHFSGRMTAPLCIAGGLCMQWLENAGVHIAAHITSIGSVSIHPYALSDVNPDLTLISSDFPVVNDIKATEMKEEILRAKADGDSVGGTIQCITTGLPVGLGDALFDGMESRISQIIFAIPAVKGISFGSGFYGTSIRGSENNDPFCVENNTIRTTTNHSGGILGGITNGMPLIFDTAIKPTPSIAKLQNSVLLDTMQESTLQIKGRHDPCIVPRAVPVVEAAAAVAIFDSWLGILGGNHHGYDIFQKRN